MPESVAQVGPKWFQVIKHRKEARFDVMAFANSLSSSIVTMEISSRVQFLQIVGIYRSSSQRNPECDVAVKRPCFWLQWSSPPTKDRTINVTNSQLKSLKSISLRNYQTMDGHHGSCKFTQEVAWLWKMSLRAQILQVVCKYRSSLPDI